MEDLRLAGIALTGRLADRRLPEPGYVPVPYLTRGVCGHLTKWPTCPPGAGEVVWCSQCRDYRAIRHLYRRGRCGQRERGEAEGASVEFYCSRHPRHGGGHADEAYGSWPGR